MTLSIADIIGVVAFLSLVLLGLFAMTIQDAVHKRPAGRVRSRLNSMAKLKGLSGQQAIQQDREQMQRDARRRRRRQALGSIGTHLTRIEIVSGRRGYILLGAALITLLLLSIVATALSPLPFWARLTTILIIPALGVYNMYRYLVRRFRLRFLDQLPDILDMIIRASQAGVPVPQALRNIGEEFDWPAGPEFRRMGDSLHLGNDMATILEDAEQRIEVPDFSFLAVTLLLQRETGGSLSETLSNLSTVVRARRDLRLKVRSLTAEGRLSGTIIAAIPFFIMGFMWFANPEYIAVLFNTERGQTLLIVVAIMLTLGVFLIRKISRLET